MTEEETKMDLTEKTEEEEGDKPLSPNEQAVANIAAMKVENDRMEKNIFDQQEMRAADMLGGTSLAGQAQVKTVEETPKEYNNRIEKEISEGMHDE